MKRKAAKKGGRAKVEIKPAPAGETRGQAWLARRLQLSQQRVSKLMKREGWRWPRRGWTDEQVAEIEKWRDALREGNNATSDLLKAGGAAGEHDAAGVGGEDEDEEGELDLALLLRRVTGAKDKIKLAGVIERALKTKVDREMALGQYMKKDDVEAGRLSRIQTVRQELGNIRLMAIKLEGRSVPEMELLLEKWAQDVCHKFEMGQP